MADTDQSLYNIRYNQVTQGMEGFGGGTPMWTPLILASDGGVSSIHSDSNANISGNVQFISGTNITLAQSGQTITVNSAGGGSPAGSDGQIQFNNAGAFGASGNFLYNLSTGVMTVSVPGGQPVILGDGTDAVIRIQETGGGIKLQDNGGSNIMELYSTGGGGTLYAYSGMGLTISTNNGVNAWMMTVDGLMNLAPLTTTARDSATPVAGSVIYNSTLNKLQVYNGTAWETVTSS